MNGFVKFIKLVVAAIPLGIVLGFSALDINQWQFWAIVFTAGIFGAAVGLVMGDGQ